MQDGGRKTTGRGTCPKSTETSPKLLNYDKNDSTNVQNESNDFKLIQNDSKFRTK